MPLTVELYDDAKGVYGRLIIDRDNVTHQFIPKSSSKEDQISAGQKRDEFHRVLYQCIDRVLQLSELSKLTKDRDIQDDDPRHGALDHMCENGGDRDGFHGHVTFTQAIDLQIMRTLILSIPRSVWRQFISENCYDQLMPTIHAYFAELNSITPTGNTAQAIEKFYRDEKALQLKAVTRVMKVTEDKKAGAPRPAPAIPVAAASTSTQARVELPTSIPLPILLGLDPDLLVSSGLDPTAVLMGAIIDSRNNSMSALSPMTALLMESLMSSGNDPMAKFLMGALMSMGSDNSTTLGYGGSPSQSPMFLSPTAFFQMQSEKSTPPISRAMGATGASSTSTTSTSSTATMLAAAAAPIAVASSAATTSRANVAAVASRAVAATSSTAANTSGAVASSVVGVALNAAANRRVTTFSVGGSSFVNRSGTYAANTSTSSTSTAAGPASQRSNPGW